MLDLEVIPERSLGCDSWEFVLGMHFSQSVAIIQSQVGIIKGVQVIYSDANPLAVDLVINLPQDGIRLIFDPVVQRLKIIEVYNMKLIKLKYCGLYFNSPEVLPSIEQIEHSFGATHPGVYDAEKHLFALNFRGLSFFFSIDSKFQPTYTHGLGSLQFANGVSPLVTRTAIYTGNYQTSECLPPELPLTCYSNMIYLEKMEVIREKQQTKGLKLYLYTEGMSRTCEPCRVSMTRQINFGQSSQTICTLLGAPSKVFYKSEDKMRIHSPSAHRRFGQNRRSDYFYNYFTLGLDILFDARSHRVKKFVLHTNYPGHYNFNMYHRCEFQIQLNKQYFNNSSSSSKLVSCDDDKEQQAKCLITAYTKWDHICEKLKPSTRPVVLNRASSTNTTNPFGSTFCYGYQDIIFEVMPNNHIASVTMYNKLHHHNALMMFKYQKQQPKLPQIKSDNNPPMAKRQYSFAENEMTTTTLTLTANISSNTSATDDNKPDIFSGLFNSGSNDNSSNATTGLTSVLNNSVTSHVTTTS